VAKDVSISVVIPARNEVHNLANCLAGVLEQDHPNVQVVVLDDGSSDGTAEVLDAYVAKHANIVSLKGGQQLPEGWFGKPWACQRAQKAATGSWLVFIDADVRLQPEALSRAVGYAMDEGVDMVTGLGKLEMGSFWERVLQPAVGGMILAGNDLDRVNDPDRKDDNLANGQFIAISRSAYDQIGGHGAVRQDILDDVGMARALVGASLVYRCLHMRTLFSCRMYTNLSELWEGWTKNLFAGMRYSWGAAGGAILFTFLFSVLGPVLLGLGLLGVVGQEGLLWGAGLTVLLHGVRGLLDIRMEHNPIYGLTHAPANVLVMAMVVHSGLRTRRGTVTWKGRTYRPSAATSVDSQRQP